MNKTVAGVLITLILAIGVGALVLTSSKRDGNPTTADEGSTSQSEQHSNLNTNNEKSDNQSSDHVSETTVVEIKEFAFNPSKIRVKKGSVVTWTNQDSTRHDIMPDRESEDFKASNLLAKGETYSFTFTKTGTYTYHCSPHPQMKGTVEVVD